MPKRSAWACALLIPVLLPCALAVSATSAERRGPEPSSDTPTLVPCTLTGSQGIASVSARCGTLEVAENPAEPDGATIFLAIAVVPALSPNPAPDALTVINGGPGASSIDLYADLAGAFARIQRDHDVVLVDQRGTGRSQRLDCAALDGFTLEESAARVRQAARDCLDALPGDPRFYTTSVAVTDLEAVRQALGYPHLNVYGVSYGTRVAQHYARRYPDRTRSLILDGVVPPGIPLGPNAALNAQRALDRLLARCEADASCAERFPGLDDTLNRLFARLRAESVPVDLAHPVTGQPMTVELVADHLVLALRLLSYAPETASLLPLIIDEAGTAGNYTPLATNALMVEAALEGALAFGMHNSVLCTEDVPFFGTVDEQLLKSTYMGPGQVRALEAICEVWPAGVLDADLHAPLRVPVPALILSGEEDPITPPEYGDRLSVQLPDAVHVIATGQGHGIAGRGCLPRLMGQFVGTGDPGALDADCVHRLKHAPFFVNLMGPVAGAPDQTP